MSTLSPAEKYDIFVGRYDFPTVQSEWRRTSPNDYTWEGLCHGWAPAALDFKQPYPVNMTNKDGIVIPFGSSDVKALLTYFMGEYNLESTVFFAGDRCKYDLENDPAKGDSSPACADINAGTIHIILANELGLRHRGLVADRDRSIEVWNQPVHTYISRIEGERPPSNGSAPGTVKEIKVVTEMKYTVEVVPQWKAYMPLSRSSQYEYYLELDAQNRIIGGSYFDWDRADFVWAMPYHGNFTGYWEHIEDIYKASVPSAKRTTSEVVDTRAMKRRVADRTVTLESASDIFGTLTNGRAGYESNSWEEWLIQPPQGATSITIGFKNFATERYRDKVKIYEYWPQEGRKGALVAVLHGNEEMGHIRLPVTVEVASPGAYVALQTDETVNMSGFMAYYTANFN